MKTFTIEIRVNFPADSREQREQALLNEMKTKAKQLYTTALLLSEGRPPNIALQSSDFFAGTEDVKVFEDEPTQSPQEVTENVSNS